MQILRDLSSREGIIIQKADKGNSVVILSKSDYLKWIKEILSDIDKFKNLNVKPGKEPNCLLQHEDKLVKTWNVFWNVLRSHLERKYTKICIHRVHNQWFYMVCPKFTNHLFIIFRSWDLFCQLLTQVRINGLSFLSLCYVMVRLMNIH